MLRLRRALACLFVLVLTWIAVTASTVTPAEADRAGVVDAATVLGSTDDISAGNDTSCSAANRPGLLEHLACWGTDGDGQLGTGAGNQTGTNVDPVVPLPLGAVRSVSLGQAHACGVLASSSAVTCWGNAGTGRLGNGAFDTGPVQTAGDAGPVDLGAGRTATAVAATSAGACALLDGGDVRCWGYNIVGQLGLGSGATVGDDETPGSVGTVDLGAGRTALAVAGGSGPLSHTCAILDTGDVRCWGSGGQGKLGYGNTANVGDNETPGAVGTVDLGVGRTASAISAGGEHTCAILDDGTVRCWGRGAEGQLGYGATDAVGDDETPAVAGPVDLGAGRTARAIAAGASHTCAVLDDGTVRCWGSGADGRLGTGSTTTIGDDETPGSVPPVDLGGNSARSVATGTRHTCVDLINEVACWGNNSAGQLGTPPGPAVGDDEVPALRRVTFGPQTPPVSEPTRPVFQQPTRTPEAGPETPPLPPLPPPPPPETEPTRGRDAVVGVISGTVLVQRRPGGPFVRLRGDDLVPIGSVVDTTDGTVRLTTAVRRGATQRARFFGGRFRIGQSPGSRQTTLKLVDAPTCRTSRATPRAKRKRLPRRSRRPALWGDGAGAFTTDGRYAAGSVKGTKWYVEDRCDGTVVRVVRGRVALRDKVRNQTVTLRAGQRRFVPKQRSAKRTSRVPTATR